jgi:hypothetical protein
MIAQISEELVWSQIVARAWCDDDVMQRLLSDPRTVLAEHDVEVPPGTDVEVTLRSRRARVSTVPGVHLPAGRRPPLTFFEKTLSDLR